MLRKQQPPLVQAFNERNVSCTAHVVILKILTQASIVNNVALYKTYHSMSQIKRNINPLRHHFLMVMMCSNPLHHHLLMVMIGLNHLHPPSKILLCNLKYWGSRKLPLIALYISSAASSISPA